FPCPAAPSLSRAVLLLPCTCSARWPELRTRPRQLLLHLSLADLLSALSYFYGVLRDFQGTSWDCVLQGALSTFANTSSFFWTMAIALYLYLSIVRGSPAGQDLLWGFHAVSWGVPLAITVAAVALRKIGYDASNVSVGWCWVNLEAEDRLLWMLLTGKLWEILAYVTLPVLYILIRKHINRAHAALSEYRPILPAAPALRPRTSVADKKLILIPLIFIFLRIWSTVRFVLTLCDSPAVQNPVLVVLHVSVGWGCLPFSRWDRGCRSCCCPQVTPGQRQRCSRGRNAAGAAPAASSGCRAKLHWQGWTEGCWPSVQQDSACACPIPVPAHSSPRAAFGLFGKKPSSL
uniref:G protein-coupled receptor 157 n=1 Tax=Serinus canaria TaxID=9135 RepID=A0A8C9NYH5_SERCA